jgi:hypothetical protein
MEFKHEYSMLLYLLSEGFKQGQITQDEKVVVKKLIFEQNYSLKKLIKQFEHDGKTDRLWLGLRQLALQEEYKDSDDVSTGTEQISSPSDSALIREKKKYSNRKKEEKVKDEKSQMEPTSETLRCKKCIAGNSPPTSLMKRYYNDDR